MSRFVDDYPFFGEPRTFPPATLNILLSHLRVSFADPAEQHAAVETWLKVNTPDPHLAGQLQRWLPARFV